jgi:hypothetical protein
MDAGEANPWQFLRLVRVLHSALSSGSVDSASVLFNLSYGPVWEIGQECVSQDHPDPRLQGMPRSSLPTWGFDELELRGFWDAWAADAQEWGETDWCYWRFLKGLPAEKAQAKLDKARAAEDERRVVARLAETGIRDVRDPFLKNRPLEDRVRLIREAGLEPVGA